jgi:thiamine pyrophosphate-dependent acetolactate synthase large subunit-like protein
MIRLTGGDALLQAAAAEQIPFVFGVVGGKLGGFLRAVSSAPGMRYIGTRHEGNGALMASAVYAASGQLGVAVGECGSGGGNLVPGIAVANANNLAMLVVTSNNQHAASYPNRGMFAEMDTLSVLRPITKWNAVVHDGRRIPELVHTALREAFTGRPGPVHLDVPQDIMRGSFDYDERSFSRDPARYRPCAAPVPGNAQIEAAVELLIEAERPLVIAGGGVTASGAAASFRALANALNAAAAATQMGHGNVASSDPRYIGMAWVCGGDAILRAAQEADVVLAIGCRFSSWLWTDRGTLLNPAARVIQIDVDPARIGKSVPVEIGICADAKLTLDAMNAAVAECRHIAPPRPWVDELAGLYRDHRGRLRALAASSGEPMHPAALAQAIGESLPPAALVTVDGGHTTFWTNDFTPVDAPRTRFNEPGMSQLGFSLPWAMTLKLLHPDVPVFNITGDGAFGFTLQELDTARRLGLAVITIIHNNAAWGVIRLGFTKAGFDFSQGRDYGTELGGTDYAAIARGFGAHGEIVRTAEEFKPALQRAIASGLPAVLDCRVRFEAHPAMPHFARMSAAGVG